ncbi:4-demethylwyosine synthase TYW1 [Candidatus Woesearchaeota archaeon]|nr:4-demethylwyosine synthase TYW1 [Candidatus Woesearchaeota archaeon]
MITPEVKDELLKQQYRIVGNHSVVKICGWTKKSVKGEGGCYKQKFYGINSHQCMQISTCLSCANRCVFCWRGYKAPVSKEWVGEIDDPVEIIEGCLKEQNSLLNGFGGLNNIELYRESKEVRHAALSLTGEPILYPQINELIEELHKRKISTFLVTNAQHPEHIKDLAKVTQLYLSVDAPNKKLLKEIDVPLFTDYWERLEKSLDYFAKRKEKTCIRLSMIKGMNMCNPKEYAELIKKGDPDFIECKGYMFVGSSRQRLSLENMPYHEEVVEFSKELIKYLPDYEIVSEHIVSRAVLFSKKTLKRDGKWFIGIDFEKFFEGKEDYSCVIKEVGLSGLGTRDKMNEKMDSSL